MELEICTGSEFMPAPLEASTSKMAIVLIKDQAPVGCEYYVGNAERRTLTNGSKQDSHLSRGAPILQLDGEKLRHYRVWEGPARFRLVVHRE